jgi:dTDP-glucose 4,6-dehydratase
MPSTINEGPTRILVTGGAGFIGSAFCRHALARPDTRIVIVDTLTYAASRATLDPILATGRAVLEQADVADRAAVERILETHRPDAIVHLAAETHVDRSIDGPAAFVRTNLLGTYTMLDAAHHHIAARPAAERARFRFVHVSTDEVFGALGDDGRFDETTAYAPNSPYAASKAGSDHLARAWHRTFGLPVVITNCSNNYGPWQFPEKLIPLTVLNAIEGRPLRVYGTGRNVRDWLHVEDHARGLAAALAHGVPGESYVFGGGAEMENIALVRAICRRLDAVRPDHAPHERAIVHVTDRPGHDHRYAVDPTKATRDLGWTPQRRFDEGLDATVDWYLANEGWWRPLRLRDDGRARLGLAARRPRLVSTATAARRMLVFGCRANWRPAEPPMGGRSSRSAGRTPTSATPPRSTAC